MEILELTQTWAYDFVYTNLFRLKFFHKNQPQYMYVVFFVLHYYNSYNSSW